MQTLIEKIKAAIMAESYEDRAGRSVISVKSALDIVDRLAAEPQAKPQEDSRWIPCSERLPEVRLTHDIFKRPNGYISDSVLVTVKSREVDGTRYYVSTDIMMGSTLESVHWLMSCGYGGSAVYGQEIIAWRPLPEEYRPEEG